MTTEITITAEQVEQMKSRLESMREQEQEWRERGNGLTADYYSGQAMGIEYALVVMGIRF